MKKNAIIAAAIFFYTNVQSQTSHSTHNVSVKGGDGATEKVSISDKKIYPIHPSFFGTNFLYWIDDDASLANGKIVSGLKEANIKVLRYPGGTVADNFHWKTSTLDNVNMFPYQSGDAETSFDEFMASGKQTGAEPMLVVNTESWAVKKDIPGGAHEAAEWLRYCQKRNYKVRYIEIGNETYWHPVMSAKEYGGLVNVYADSLRKVDPKVIIGINGHWDVDFVGTKERVKPDALPTVLSYRENISSKADAKKYDDYLKENTILPITAGDQKWWNTLATVCGKNIDMIIVHWYFAPSQLKQVTPKLTQVRELFQKMYPQKTFLLNMSEYNVTTKTPESYMHLTEMIGNMLKAGMDITALWPMRMNYKKPTLLDHDTDRTSILYEIHKRLSTTLTGDLVQSVSSDKIPAFASSNSVSATAVLVGYKIKSATAVKVSVPGNRKFQTCSVWKISGEEFDYKMSEQKLAVQAGTISFSLAPSEVAIITFK